MPGTFKKDNASKMLEPCSLTEHSKSTDAWDKAETEVRVKALSAQVEEKAPKSDDTKWRKRSKETSDSEAKKQKHSRKVGLGSKTTKKISLSSGHVVSAKKSDLLFEPEEMPLHQSIVIAVRRFNKHGLSVPTGTKKRRLLDGTSDEDVTEAFRDKKAKSLHRDGSYLEETPKTKFKRKRTPRKEVKESSETPDLAEQLVGSKIKVWWPQDKRFYEGVVDSYDPIKKKHKAFLVLYGDGDEEKLNLNRQRWELIKDDIFAVQEQEIDVPKTATSSGVLQKAKSETKSNSLKRSKAVSSLKRAENISKTRARRSAYGAVPNEPTVVEKPADHNTSGPDSGSEDDGKNTPGPDSGSEDDVLETVNPSDNGGPKAGTEYGSFNSEQTTSVGVTLSKDESSKGDDESQGSDGYNREQQGGVSSSFSPETE
ncbi:TRANSCRIPTIONAL REGULATOR [Salix koriyanagi]|uniref:TRANSCRIPTIONAL REGULATOR n=1 Tax=Salix koriyanagi TaxID=2511006 RepID=A0A9Q0T621_9ROSI|nr:TRANSCRIPTIONAL REGULATOR [Salix koriyanagi]